MKQLLGVILLLATFNATAQIIGIQANYNFAIMPQTAYNNVKKKPFDAGWAGIYYNAPIYKNLHYTVGINYMYVNQEFLPIFGEPLPGYSYYGDFYSFNVRKDLIELPVGLSYGIVAKSSNRVQLWAHANYAYGQMVMHKYTYEGFGGEYITDEKITKNDYTHSFKAELEVRFRFAERYFASLFGSYRFIKFHSGPSQQRYCYYAGAGIRLGFDLKKRP